MTLSLNRTSKEEILKNIAIFTSFPISQNHQNEGYFSSLPSPRKRTPKLYD